MVSSHARGGIDHRHFVFFSKFEIVLPYLIWPIFCNNKSSHRGKETLKIYQTYGLSFGSELVKTYEICHSFTPWNIQLNFHVLEGISWKT